MRFLRPLLIVSIISAFAAVPVATQNAGAAEIDVCTAVQSGNNVQLRWNDDGGDHVVRRNGDWLTSLGQDVRVFVDRSAPAGASYVIRTWVGDTYRDRTCSTGVVECSLTRSAGALRLEWVDDGGEHVVRRNGEWLASPGSGTGLYIDADPDLRATYVVRSWAGASYTDRPCAAGVVECRATMVDGGLDLRWVDSGGVHVVRRMDQWVATPGPDTATHLVVDPASTGGYAIRTWIGDTPVDRPCSGDVEDAVVIHVSLDGLRSDHVSLMPNLQNMRDRGASTLNARTDPAFTKTLPNHSAQFTGRPVGGAGGHGVDYNNDLGFTIHDEAGEYVSSVFDVVHDRGGSTVVFAGKSKFDMIDRSWNATNGGSDTVGADDGRDKIDVFERMDPFAAVGPFVDALEDADGPTFAFYHVRTPDEIGHLHGWATPEYRDAVQRSDALLGDLVAAVEAAGIDNVSWIITSDHGGPTGGFLHDIAHLESNYTIPFVVAGPQVAAGADLYALNSGRRIDPGSAQLPTTGTQPIRGHETANLALELLGLPPVPGSTFNAGQDLRVR